MELTVKEISYLSEIYQKKKYPYIKHLPLLVKKEAKEVEEGLEKKGIFEHQKFSKAGLFLARLLESTAVEEYSKWNHVHLFPFFEGFAIVKKIGKDTIDIDYVKKELMIVGVLANLGNADKVEEKPQKIEIIEDEQFIKIMEKNKEKEGCFYELVKGKESESGMFYIDDGYLVHYENKTKRLYWYPKSKAYKKVEKVMEMKGEEPWQ